MKILIAEDDASSKIILENLLQKKGFDVVTVPDGHSAWNVMQETEYPRMAIIDWLMPLMDGEELCRRIRSRETDTPVYIIMLTVKDNKTDVIRGLNSGANDYVTKPYDPDELFARINVGRKILDLQESLVEKIDSLKKNEKKIETLLAEKDFLLYEVHHRIKNNMNTIMNLLTIQADTTAQEEASIALKNASGRLKSMAILYDKLYRSDNLSSMSVKKYIPDLAEDIISIFSDRYKVSVNFDIEDFDLDVQQLSALGIILNEIVFNSMKYAFVGRDSGKIMIKAFLNESRAFFIFADDGIGLPLQISFDDPKSFGFTLVRGIAGQAGGSIRMIPGPGTQFVLEIDVKK